VCSHPSRSSLPSSPGSASSTSSTPAISHRSPPPHQPAVRYRRRPGSAPRYPARGARPTRLLAADGVRRDHARGLGYPLPLSVSSPWPTRLTDCSATSAARGAARTRRTAASSGRSPRSLSSRISLSIFVDDGRLLDRCSAIISRNSFPVRTTAAASRRSALFSSPAIVTRRPLRVGQGQRGDPAVEPGYVRPGAPPRP